MTQSEGTSEIETDAAWLREFVETGSETAFQSLVEKYLSLTLAIAVRRTGNRTLAEEIAQNVFAVLARKAKRLKATPTLAGWLYRVTIVECSAALRKERARTEKMERIMEKARADSEGESVWREALPLLDQAIDELPDADRDVLLLRFFEQKSFRQIGELTGATEGTSQKRTERALSRLSRALSGKGVAVTAGALAAGMPIHLAEAAPAALVGTISSSALAAAPGLSAGALILKSIEIMTYAKTKTALVVAVVAAVPLGMQWNENNQLRERVDALENRPVVENTVRVASEPRIMERRAAAKSATIAGSGGQVASLTADDYLREWTLALAERDPLKRSMMVSRLLAGVTAANAPSVAAIFDRAGTTGASYGAELAVFMRVWGKVDGPTALEHVVNLEGGVTGSAMMQAAVAGWATANPHGAREWVETLDEGANKEELIVGLLDGWATSDLDGASRYAETRPRTPARNRMRKMLMERALVSGGIQGAQQWFYGVSGEGHNRMYKQLALDELTQKIVRQDPAAAARWLKQQDGEPHLGGRAITATAAELSKRSPTDALAFVDSLEHMKNGQMTSVYSQVMRSWAEQDPAAAGAWLNQNPEHPRYDAVASRYIMAIAEVDPAAALKWANSITKEHKRHNGLLIAGAGMLAQYGEAAIPQLKAAGFTDEMIEAAPKQRAWAEAHPDSEKMQGITVGNDGVIIVGQGPNGYEQRAATLLDLNAAPREMRPAPRGN